MRRPLYTITVCLATLLSGCATRWEKPGGSEAELSRDNYQCQMETSSAYPVQMSSTGGGYQAPSQTRCVPVYGGGMNCTTVPGQYIPPVQSDVNLYARIFAMNSCLMSRGWKQSK